MKPTQTERILARLRRGPVTNIELNNDMHIFRYGARILELRNLGHDIESKRVKGSKWLFTLHQPVSQPQLFDTPKKKVLL